MSSLNKNASFITSGIVALVYYLVWHFNLLGWGSMSGTEVSIVTISVFVTCVIYDMYGRVDEIHDEVV